MTSLDRRLLKGFYVKSKLELNSSSDDEYVRFIRNMSDMGFEDKTKAYKEPAAVGKVKNRFQ